MRRKPYTQIGEPRAYIRTSDRTWDIEDRFALTTTQVSECEELQYSGLLDAQGNPLYRQRARVGFLNFED